MPVLRVCALLAGVMLAAVGPARAQQVPIPGNIDAGPFAQQMRGLLRFSETFRAQCDRIAADPRVHVRVSVTYSVQGGGRAQTTFHRYRSGSLAADVEIVFGANYRELLGHELEHVIEQLDGVDLRRQANEGLAWEIVSGAFETRRASLAGLQVLRESEATHAHAAAFMPAR